MIFRLSQVEIHFWIKIKPLRRVALFVFGAAKKLSYRRQGKQQLIFLLLPLRAR